MTNIIKKKLFESNSGNNFDPTPIENRLNILENNEYKVTYFTEINSTTGTITIPTAATILLDQYEGGIDAFVSTLSSGKVTGYFPETSSQIKVDVSSFDALGNYSLTDTPSSFPVGLIYVIKIKSLDLNNLDLNNIIDYYFIDNKIKEIYLKGLDQTNSTTTPQIINGASFHVEANSRYYIRMSLRTGCNGVGGVFFSLIIPTLSTMGVNVYGFTTSSTVDANQLLINSGVETGLAYCRLNSSSCMIDIYGTITTGNNSGMVNIRFRSAVSTQISTIYVEGTYGTITKFK
jgi:hypothetical protein